MSIEKKNSISVELEKEREVLADCIRAYDLAIAATVDSDVATAISKTDPERAAAIEQIEAIKCQFNLAAESATACDQGSSGRTDSPLAGAMSWVGRCGILALVIVVTLLSSWNWTSFRLAELAVNGLQGHWQQFKVSQSGETEADYYRSYEGVRQTTTSYYPFDESWRAHESDVELTPAKGFFLVRVGDTDRRSEAASAEFYVQILDDKINEIRGVHSLDPIRVPRVNTWRRADGVPLTTAGN